MNSCQVCQKERAAVHIIDLVYADAADAAADPEIAEKYVCEPCSNAMQAPHSPGVGWKGLPNVWKLLQSAQRARSAAETACPKCGMTLGEFRAKGRLGCPHDYEFFRRYLDPLLQRMHNAASHVGRLPGVDDREALRMQRLSELRQRLEVAVREEQYENAARLRDQLQDLERGAAG